MTWPRARDPKGGDNPMEREAVEGGWGLWGPAHRNEEIVDAAKREIATLRG